MPHDAQQTPSRLPDDVVVGRVLRALTRMMWVLCGAAVICGAIGLALLGARDDAALRAAAWVLLAAACVGLAGAVIAFAGAVGARDASTASQWLARAEWALRLWGWVGTTAIVLIAVAAATVSHAGLPGWVGATLGGLVGCQVVVVATALRRRWPGLLEVPAR